MSRWPFGALFWRSSPTGTGTGTGTNAGKAPHRPSLQSSVVAALLAVGVVLGFVALSSGGNTTDSLTPPSTSLPPPGTTPINPVTTRPHSPTPVAPTTTEPHLTVVQPPPTTTTTAAPTLCGSSDLQVTASAEDQGGTAQLATVLHALRTCQYQPQGAGPYGCESWIVVTDSAGRQVWPASNQNEQCSTWKPGLLVAGSTETLRATWDEMEPGPAGITSSRAPQGTYQAVGSWAWDDGSSSPYVGSATSASFSIG